MAEEARPELETDVAREALGPVCGVIETLPGGFCCKGVVAPEGRGVGVATAPEARFNPMIF